MYSLKLLNRQGSKLYKANAKEVDKPRIKLEREGVVEYVPLEERENEGAEVGFIVGGKWTYPKILKTFKIHQVFTSSTPPQDGHYVSASSTADSDWGAWRAFDTRISDSDGAWLGGYSDKNPRLTIGIPRAECIHSFVIYPRATGDTSLNYVTIRGLAIDDTYVVLASNYLVDNKITKIEILGFENIEFKSYEFTAHNTTSLLYTGFREIEIESYYKLNKKPSPEIVEHILLNSKVKTPTFTGHEKDGFSVATTDFNIAGYEVWRAFDGSDDTSWQTNVKKATLMFTFPTPQCLDKLEVIPRKEGSDNHLVRVSVDGLELGSGIWRTLVYGYPVNRLDTVIKITGHENAEYSRYRIIAHNDYNDTGIMGLGRHTGFATLKFHTYDKYNPHQSE